MSDAGSVVVGRRGREKPPVERLVVSPPITLARPPTQGNTLPSIRIERSPSVRDVTPQHGREARLQAESRTSIVAEISCSLAVR